MPRGRTILLFTRAPESEARAKQLPLVEGARVFAGFLRAWQQRAEAIGAELMVVSPAACASTLARLLPNASVAIQSGSAFGARVESAFALACQRGGSAIPMAFGDTPPPARRELEQSCVHLESRSAAMVLAPSSDGGVNAIGFNSVAERPLGDISWPTANACVQLRAEAERSRLALLLTSPGHDLDCAANVPLLYRLSRVESDWRPFRWLLQSLLLACHPAVVVVGDAIGEFAGGSHVTYDPSLGSCGTQT
jgi:glycosyltransferase A (GT-A) superfamily protein (DUF2064 family)